MKKSLLIPLFILALAACAVLAPAAQPAPAPDLASLRGCRGTYDNPPRLANQRLDLPRLIDELIEIRANTYNFLIHHQPTDWEDLQAFLPLARAKNILVWVSLVPPSESPPRNAKYSEPFRLDYVRWAGEIARLSARQPNLVAWSIDDFAHNLKFYTPEMIRAMRAKTRELDPRLAFVPCVYFKQTTPAFAAAYRDLVDGLLFPYRAESAKTDLQDPTRVADEIAKIREIMGRPGLPIVLDVYATAHSRLGASTPDYVREVMARGKDSADGVLVYCHQDKQKSAEKYNIIKTLFNQWAEPAAQTLPPPAPGR